MKKSLVALALFGAFAATAQAQSSVQIYGTIDAGVAKATGNSAIVTKRDNNKLGFRARKIWAMAESYFPTGNSL
jgi:predicted porin